jgi:hypothetical protein
MNGGTREAFAQGHCNNRSVDAGMVPYNFSAVVVLVLADLQLQPVGIALWPAVVLHAAPTAWCVVYLARKLVLTTK